MPEKTPEMAGQSWIHFIKYPGKNMSNQRIFIVEDEQIVALDLQHRLARLGHEIVGNAGSGEEALRKMEKVRMDLVLMDIKLGGQIDGIELAEIINQRFGAPVIFVTAYSDEETLRRVKAGNACGFIIKPFTDEELQATINLGVHEHVIEEQLKQSEEQYRCLFDNAPVGYHELDLQGNIVRVNQTELEMLGYQAADMVGKPVWRFNQDVEAAQRSVQARLGSGEISSRPFESNYVRRDGRAIPVLAQDYPIRDRSGGLTGIRSTIQDISLLKEEQARRERLEHSLRQSEKLEGLSVLAGALAHELNNQLMAIQGNASLALLGPPSAEESSAHLQNIIDACRKSTSILKQLMVGAGLTHGEFQPLDLSKLAAGYFQSFRENMAGRADLRLKLAENLPVIRGDAGQLQQLLAILVANAVEALPGGSGIVQVETGPAEPEGNGNNYDIIFRSRPDKAGNSCCLSVTDNGLGMDKAARARLFDPFFTTKGVGRGLGLSTALGIVKNHGADIEVRSAPGVGTTVRVIFPVGA